MGEFDDAQTTIIRAVDVGIDLWDMRGQGERFAWYLQLDDVMFGADSLTTLATLADGIIRRVHALDGTPHKTWADLRWERDIAIEERDEARAKAVEMARDVLADHDVDPGGECGSAAHVYVDETGITDIDHINWPCRAAEHAQQIIEEWGPWRPPQGAKVPTPCAMCHIEDREQCDCP